MCAVGAFLPGWYVWESFLFSLWFIRNFQCFYCDHGNNCHRSGVKTGRSGVTGICSNSNLWGSPGGPCCLALVSPFSKRQKGREGREGRDGREGTAGRGRRGRRGGRAKMQEPLKVDTSHYTKSRYLQPHGSRWPRKTSRTFITFLPKKPLLAPRPWLSISSLQGDNRAGLRTCSWRPTSSRVSGPSECPLTTDTHGGAWLSDGALGTCRPRRTLWGKNRRSCFSKHSRGPGGGAGQRRASPCTSSVPTHGRLPPWNRQDSCGSFPGTRPPVARAASAEVPLKANTQPLSSHHTPHHRPPRTRFTNKDGDDTAHPRVSAAWLQRLGLTPGLPVSTGSV